MARNVGLIVAALLTVASGVALVARDPDERQLQTVRTTSTTTTTTTAPTTTIDLEVDTTEAPDPTVAAPATTPRRTGATRRSSGTTTTALRGDDGSATAYATDSRGDHGARRDGRYKVDLAAAHDASDPADDVIRFWAEAHDDFTFATDGGLAHDAWFAWQLDTDAQDADTFPDCVLRVAPRASGLFCDGTRVSTIVQVSRAPAGRPSSRASNTILVELTCRAVFPSAGSVAYHLETGHPGTDVAGDRAPDTGARALVVPAACRRPKS